MMEATTKAALFAVTLLVVLVAGCASPSAPNSAGPDSAWRGRDIRHGDPPWAKADIAASWSQLDVWGLSEGDTIHYDWFVLQDQEIRFRILEDKANSVVTFHDMRGIQENGTFNAPESGTFALVWTNTQGPPVELHFKAPANGNVYQQPPGQDPGGCKTLREVAMCIGD